MTQNSMNETLAQWAERRGIGTDEIARAMGMSRRYIGDILDGIQPVRTRFMGKFMEIYGPSAAAEAFGLADPEPA